MPAITAEQVGENGVSYLYTVTLSSEHIVRAFNLPLPENVRVRVGTTVTVEGHTIPTASAMTHLFPPSTGIWRRSDQHPNTGFNESLSSEHRPHQSLQTMITQGRGGNYGLVLELPGDMTAFDACRYDAEACGPEPDEEAKDRTIEVVFHVRVCPLNSIPTDTGCALVVLPHWENTDLYRTVGPYRIFSPAGFADYTDPCFVLSICSLRFK